jgi:acetyl-CoA C-acetyltransferase
MRQVAIIGVGDTKFGELWDSSFRQLGIEAGLAALQDAGVGSRSIDALYIGNMDAGRLVEQEHLGALLADYAGLSRDHIPAVRVEAAEASGALALHQAWQAVASGMYDIVVVGGAEKMTDVSDADAVRVRCAGIDQEWEGEVGATDIALQAIMARRHMLEYGTTREQMAAVAVKNHANGAKNPKAHFRNTVTADAVLKATKVAEPFGVLDCAPVSDGAAALVLCPADKAKRFSERPVRVAGIGHACDTIALSSRRDICTMDAVVRAVKKGYHMARITPKDVDVVETHDTTTFTEIVTIEDLLLVEKGAAGKMALDGATAIDGKVPVNPSGGLKARGMPLGAIGVAQVVELVRQLRGQAEGRQVPNARTGLALNIGGTGGTACVTVLEAIT